MYLDTNELLCLSEYVKSFEKLLDLTLFLFPFLSIPLSFSLGELNAFVGSLKRLINEPNRPSELQDTTEITTFSIADDVGIYAVLH